MKVFGKGHLGSTFEYSFGAIGIDKVSSSDGLYICFHLPLYFFRSSQAEILFKGLKPSTKREMDNFM